MNFEVEFDSEGEDRTERCELSDGGKCLVEVDTFDLGKTLGDNACLVFLDCTIGSAFNAEHPFRPNNFFAS